MLWPQFRITIHLTICLGDVCLLYKLLPVLLSVNAVVLVTLVHHFITSGFNRGALRCCAVPFYAAVHGFVRNGFRWHFGDMTRKTPLPSTSINHNGSPNSLSFLLHLCLQDEDQDGWNGCIRTDRSFVGWMGWLLVQMGCYSVGTTWGGWGCLLGDKNPRCLLRIFSRIFLFCSPGDKVVSGIEP
ncbi:hypothetical protein AVEN_215327-1 [Araneus ventricosus]|uniref:Uncharacterized protein n=1 Tax=Araneus ventricosus TaxID=182803 RepID=A0A4Y2U2L9_ARAVE|nr:hypothetical protein AVEN_215327-1 [Araneus ventricosus]